MSSLHRESGIFKQLSHVENEGPSHMKELMDVLHYPRDSGLHHLVDIRAKRNLGRQPTPAGDSG